MKSLVRKIAATLLAASLVATLSPATALAAKVDLDSRVEQQTVTTGTATTEVSLIARQSIQVVSPGTLAKSEVEQMNGQIYVTIIGGEAPYKIKWTKVDPNGNPIGTPIEKTYTADDLVEGRAYVKVAEVDSLPLTTENSTRIYSVEVVDDYGDTVSDTIVKVDCAEFNGSLDIGSYYWVDKPNFTWHVTPLRPSDGMSTGSIRSGASLSAQEINESSTGGDGIAFSSMHEAAANASQKAKLENAWRVFLTGDNVAEHARLGQLWLELDITKSCDADSDAYKEALNNAAGNGSALASALGVSLWQFADDEASTIANVQYKIDNGKLIAQFPLPYKEDALLGSFGVAFKVPANVATYHVIASVDGSGAPGQIDPVGEGIYFEGDQPEFRLFPGGNSVVASVLVNGSSSWGTLTGNTFKLSPIAANMANNGAINVVVKFAEKPLPSTAKITAKMIVKGHPGAENTKVEFLSANKSIGVQSGNALGDSTSSYAEIATTNPIELKFNVVSGYKVKEVKVTPTAGSSSQYSTKTYKVSGDSLKITAFDSNIDIEVSFEPGSEAPAPHTLTVECTTHMTLVEPSKAKTQIPYNDSQTVKAKADAGYKIVSATIENASGSFTKTFDSASGEEVSFDIENIITDTRVTFTVVEASEVNPPEPDKEVPIGDGKEDPIEIGGEPATGDPDNGYKGEIKDDSGNKEGEVTVKPSGKDENGNPVINDEDPLEIEVKSEPGYDVKLPVILEDGAGNRMELDDSFLDKNVNPNPSGSDEEGWTYKFDVTLDDLKEAGLDPKTGLNVIPEFTKVEHGIGSIQINTGGPITPDANGNYKGTVAGEGVIAVTPGKIDNKPVVSNKKPIQVSIKSEKGYGLGKAVIKGKKDGKDAEIEIYPSGGFVKGTPSGSDEEGWAYEFDIPFNKIKDVLDPESGIDVCTQFIPTSDETERPIGPGTGDKPPITIGGDPSTGGGEGGGASSGGEGPGDVTVTPGTGENGEPVVSGNKPIKIEVSGDEGYHIKYPVRVTDGNGKTLELNAGDLKPGFPKKNDKGGLDYEFEVTLKDLLNAGLDPATGLDVTVDFERDAQGEDTFDITTVAVSENGASGKITGSKTVGKGKPATIFFIPGENSKISRVTVNGYSVFGENVNAGTITNNLKRFANAGLSVLVNTQRPHIAFKTVDASYEVCVTFTPGAPTTPTGPTHELQGGASIGSSALGNGHGSVWVEGNDPGATVTVFEGDQGDEGLRVNIVPNETAPNGPGTSNYVDKVVLRDTNTNEDVTIFDIPVGVPVYGDPFDPSTYVATSGLPSNWKVESKGNGQYLYTIDEGSGKHTRFLFDTNDFSVTFFEIGGNYGVIPTIEKARQISVEIDSDANSGSATHGGTYGWKYGAEDVLDELILEVYPSTGFKVEYLKLDSVDKTEELRPKKAEDQTRYARNMGGSALDEFVATITGAEEGNALDEAPWYEYGLAKSYIENAQGPVRVNISFIPNGNQGQTPGQTPGTGDKEEGTFVLTAQVAEGGHGTIAEDLVQTVKAGDDFTFHFLPESTNYRVVSIQVDDQAKQTYTANSYTFRDVQADHTITVEFGTTPFAGDNTPVARTYRTLTSLAQTGDLNAPAMMLLATVACGALGVAILMNGRTRRQKESQKGSHAK